MGRGACHLMTYYLRLIKDTNMRHWRLVGENRVWSNQRSVFQIGLYHLVISKNLFYLIDSVLSNVFLICNSCVKLQIRKITTEGPLGVAIPRCVNLRTHLLLSSLNSLEALRHLNLIRPLMIIWIFLVLRASVAMMRSTDSDVVWESLRRKLVLFVLLALSCMIVSL
jgi:hypothetical protein